MTKHSQWCPEDKYLCDLCFGCFFKEELFAVVYDGDRPVKWVTVCNECGEKDGLQKLFREKA